MPPAGVLLPDATPEEVSSAILAGLTNLPITVIPVPTGCDPLSVSFTPASATVTSGDPVSFIETIQVPDDNSLEGTSISCAVEFHDDKGNLVGTQDITITIPDVTPPVVSCVETVNPHGNNVPKAGQKSPGQNEDGFYQVLAEDNVDPMPVIDVSGFGPFASGDNLKITEAKGAEPTVKKIGSENGQADAVAAHLILNGDAVVTAVDASGNVSEPVSCLVPPPPK